MNRWNSLSYTVQVSNDCGYHKYEEVEDTQYKLDVGIRYHNLLHIKAVWLQPGKKGIFLNLFWRIEFGISLKHIHTVQWYHYELSKNVKLSASQYGSGGLF